MASFVNLMALGLNTAPNQLQVPQGSLTEATNVIIRDNLIYSRRGFKIYGDSLPDTSKRVKQLFSYRSRIIRHFNTTLQFDDGKGSFDDFSGTFTEADSSLRMKSVESNGNFFFTTSEGIKKISAKTGAELSSASGYVQNAGGIKALDGEGVLNITPGSQSGFLPKDSAVAYRIVWGINDANDNLILGTPSSRIVVYNPLDQLMNIDFSRLLGALDDINSVNCLIDDGDYVLTLNLPSNATEAQLRTNLIDLATKLDNDILYGNSTGVDAPLTISTASITGSTLTINFSSGDATLYVEAGDFIEIKDFQDSGAASLDGNYQIITVTATQLTVTTTGAAGAVTVGASAEILSNTYRSITQPAIPPVPSTNTGSEAIQTYLNNIILALQEEPNGVIPTADSNTYIQVLDVTNTTNVDLTIYIPEEVTENHFYQIYRSPIATADGGVNLFNDIVPSDELQLVYEAFPTASELSAKIIEITDIAPDEFRGEYLYTNAISGEGILNANDIPPFAKDINRFKNVVFYANTRTKYRKNVQLLGVQNIIDEYNASNNPSLTIATNDNANIYKFTVGQIEITDLTTVSGASLNSSGTASYFLINSANDEQMYYVWYNIGTATDPAISGRTGIEIMATAGDTAAQIAEKTLSKLARLNQYFDVTINSNVLTISNIEEGYSEGVAVGTSGFSLTVVQSGQGEKIEQEVVEITTVADVAGSLAGTYFTVNTSNDQYQYYCWFKVSGSGSDPLVANKTGLQIDISINATAAEVAEAVVSELNGTGKFSASNISNVVTSRVLNYGEVSAATAGTSGFTITIINEGSLEVLVSSQVSVASAVEKTSLSLIKAINLNEGETIYGYYLSGINETPGQMLFESQSLEDNQFFLSTSSEEVGVSFSPDLSGEINISSISAGSPTTMLVTTATNHNLQNLDTVVISGSDSTPSIDGVYQITYVSANSFRIPLYVTSGGTAGFVTKTSRSEFADNENKPNRVYFSKIDQPESVPLLNYFDVGATDKQILRILPLRDSLFVFKEDGLFRVSGESAPFNLALFDSSFKLIAPDSLGVVGNAIFSWTLEGINTVTESGASIISRPIYDTILKLASPRFTNFKSLTWGIGYESDNAYYVFTNSDDGDVYATIGYRYNILDGNWTSLDFGKTCGIIHSDDRMYLGASDVSYIEQERKDFTRTDFADREYEVSLTANNYFNKVIKFASIENFDEGDVLVQTQHLTIYEYNMLLKKLDLDSGINDSDYYSTLFAIAGDNLRTKIQSLANKLDADSGVVDTDYASIIASKSGTITAISVSNPTIITCNNHGLEDGRYITITGSDSTPSIDGSYAITYIDANTFSIDMKVTSPGTTGSFTTDIQNFLDVKACYNAIINKLNMDTGVSFSNYSLIDTTTDQEMVILSVNKITKEITVNSALELIIGPMTLYKAISTVVTYSPITMNDPLNMKHFSTTTMMFTNKAFTNATLSFATDLLPQFIDVDFSGTGNGIFGHSNDFGNSFFGGNSHSAPFRTYVPRQCQRCRYLVLKFNHKIAREQYVINGITVTGKPTSGRAYR